MKKSLALLTALAACCVARADVKPHVVTTVVNGVTCLVNYDESRVAPYRLEDPLP